MDAWRATSAYLYILRLDRPALAWEYLRRNSKYRLQWARGELDDQTCLARWGCLHAENPDRTALEAMPSWALDSPEVVHVIGVDRAESDTGFSLWAQPPPRTLHHAGLHLLMESGGARPTLRMRIDGELRDGQPYAYVIRADGLLRERIHHVCKAAEQQIRRRPATRASKQKRFSRNMLFHARCLQALDGKQAGATQRDIAMALFGEEAVRSRWSPDSHLRAQVRHLLRRGQLLVNGEYRALLSGK